MSFAKYIKVNADVLDVSNENIQIKQLHKIYYLTGWLSSFRKGTNFNIATHLRNISSVQLIKEEVLKNVDLSIKNKLVYIKFFSIYYSFFFHILTTSCFFIIIIHRCYFIIIKTRYNVNMNMIN